MLQVSGSAGLVLMLVFSGFACAGKQAGDAQGEKGHTVSGQAIAVTVATHDSVVRASASAGAIGDAGNTGTTVGYKPTSSRKK